MRYFNLFLVVIFCFNGSAIAGKADVIAVKIRQEGQGVYQIDVTVSHDDQGWDHYADRWEVLAPDSSIIDTRVLAHPHTNEQPFTRSLSGVKIPVGVHQVTVRAHDSVHAYGGEIKVVTLD